MTYALSFIVSLDGGIPTNYHFDGVAACCDPTVIQPLYNFEVYNITSLPLGDHELSLTLVSGYTLDANMSVIGYISSIINFDYAFVNSSASIGLSSNIHPSITSAVNASAKSTSR